MNKCLKAVSELSAAQEIFQSAIQMYLIKLEAEDLASMGESLQWHFHDKRTVAVDGWLYDILLRQADFGAGHDLAEQIDARLKTHGCYMEYEGGGVWVFATE